MRTTLLRILLALPVLALPLLAGGAALAAGQDTDGFLYGKVVTESGNEYVGFLRWGDEESFWDDLFHSTKEDRPYADEGRDRDRERRRETRIRIFRWDLKVGGDSWDGSRIFIARFGDIEKIRCHGDSEAEVFMKSGQVYDVSGYSNDVTSDILVRDEKMGDIDVRWNRIDTIEFMPAPRGADPGVWRLYGTVESDAGDFTGWIQWDKQECLSTDELDGDTEDGDISIEFGDIRSIERRGRKSSLVELKDGRTLRLRGSNDVNDENRGIMVEDPRFGRATVSWDAFEKATFEEHKSSGRGYDDYGKAGWLEGTVTDTDGRTYSGRLVIDLDETETWEMLNGSWRDVEFDIPLALIETIEPLGHDESRVRLRSGEELVLADGQDVADRNEGVLILKDDDDRDPEYLAWDEVERIELKR
jgi:hypothetical protein